MVTRRDYAFIAVICMLLLYQHAYLTFHYTDGLRTALVEKPSNEAARQMNHFQIHSNGSVDCHAMVQHAHSILDSLMEPLSANELSGISWFMDNLPPGQIDKSQCRLLYKAAKMLPEPFLEIGAFVGRSASCISAGIRHSQLTKRFYSVDLHISSKEEYFRFFGDPDGPNLTVEHMEKWWSVGLQNHDYPWYVSQGGTLNFFEQNLAKVGLSDLVVPMKGEFRRTAPQLEYGFVYADHLHDPAEIRTNLPGTLSLLSRGGVLISDDIVHGKRETFEGENKNLMLRMSASLAHGVIGRYFVQVLPPKPALHCAGH